MTGAVAGLRFAASEPVNEQYMVSSITIHCDCGTDIRIATTDDPATCPGCETAFATTVFELPDNCELRADHDASSTRYCPVTYCGP